MDNFQLDYILYICNIMYSYKISIDVCTFIACQFALESNFGKSKLARENFNHCGMKNPLVRISSSLHAGDSNFYWATYSSIDSCCVDYLLCLQYHRPISVDYDTPEHFARFISKFYCPEKDYIAKIFKIYNQFNHQFKIQNNGN